jgi:competence protein ComGC
MTKKQKNQIKSMQSKKAFTMMELILVAIVMAVLIAVFYPTIMSNSKENTLTGTVNTDIKNIIKASNKWKTQDAQSDGTFANITTNAICPYLPQNMRCDKKGIHSSGFHDANGYGRIIYKVASDKVATAGDSIKIFADASTLANVEHWQDEDKKKFDTVATNLMKKVSTQPKNVEIDKKASNIGNPNDAFEDKGNDHDAKGGVRKIVQ